VASAEALATGDDFRVPRLSQPRGAAEGEPLDLEDIRNSLRSLMWRSVGVERSGMALTEAAETVEGWCRYVLPRQFADPRGWQLQNMLEVARLMIRAAICREETRGVHVRGPAVHAHELALRVEHERSAWQQLQRSLCAEQAAAAAKARAAAEQAAAEQSQAGQAAQQKSPRQPQSAANSPERQAESLAARETVLARDRLLAEEIAAALEEQSSARDAVAASAKQLEHLPTDAASETAPDPAAAQNREAAAADLAQAKERFADAQRAVGERVAAALDQQEIGNQPLRESLAEASRQDDLGTGFVPESPETTADMIAGNRATAAAEEILAAADGEQQPGQDSKSGQSSDSQQARSQQPDQGRDGDESKSSQGEQSPSQTAQNENSQRETSQSKTAQDEKSKNDGSRTGEARDEGPLRETDAVDKQGDAGRREGDTDVDEKSFERDAWFAKLPPEVRKAIRAGSQRRAPRGYEEKMDRYFKNIE
jgi:hypothetical protein